MEGLIETTPFEHTLLGLCQEKLPPLYMALLWRALERGDTALFEMEEIEFLSLLSLEKPTEKSKKAYLLFLEAVHSKPLFFRRFYEMEKAIAESIQARLAIEDVPSVNPLSLEKLNNKQQEAVFSLLSSHIFFLTGGPGTGKTYTAGQCMKVYLDQSRKKSPLKVLLLAPTGKAVQALERSMLSSLQEGGRDGEAFLQAMTLHAFLLNEAPWQADLLFVDESSMIDTELMYFFLKKVPLSTRLFFLGDAEQLPPIEPGQPFADLVHLLEQKRDRHVCRLVLCERTESRDLVLFAEQLRDGKLVDPSSFGPSIHWHEASLSSSWHEAEESWQKAVFLPWQDPSLTEEQAKRLICQRVVLTAERKGMAGCQELMSRAEKKLLLSKGTFAPLLVLKNNYRLRVMNGEIGLIQRRGEGQDSVDFQKHTIPLLLLDRWQYAYAMTVHKSQGSEFQEVHLVLPPSSLLSRKVLYTAATRAKKSIHLYGSVSTLHKAISQTQKRMTLLPSFLSN